MLVIARSSLGVSFETRLLGRLVTPYCKEGAKPMTYYEHFGECSISPRRNEFTPRSCRCPQD